MQALATPGPYPDPLPRAFVDSGLDLAVSALHAAVRDPRPSGSAQPAGRLRRYALAHLDDPALSPRAVALASYVSVRQLHRLFAAEGVTFGGWVREQRLRRCRDDLADPRLGQLSVAEIAARHGFRSAAHFARAFRARYGVTPAEHRRAARAEAASGAAVTSQHANTQGPGAGE